MMAQRSYARPRSGSSQCARRELGSSSLRSHERYSLALPLPVSRLVFVFVFLFFAGVMSCGRDVPVGNSAGSGGLPFGDLAQSNQVVPEPEPAANDVFVGDWRTDERDLDDLERWRSISGNLVLEDLQGSTLALFSLQEVGGDLVVCRSDSLTTLNLGELLSVGGQFRICDVDTLASLTAPKLRSIGAALRLERAPSLRVLNLSDLETAGGLQTRNLGLNTLALDALQILQGDLSIATAPGTDVTAALNTVRLSALTSIDRDLTLFAHPTLRALELPALLAIGGVLTVQNNPQLRTLKLGALSQVGVSGCICDNPSLPACVATPLAGLTDAGVVEVRGNAGPGRCR